MQRKNELLHQALEAADRWDVAEPGSEEQQNAAAAVVALVQSYAAVKPDSEILDQLAAVLASPMDYYDMVGEFHRIIGDTGRSTSQRNSSEGPC